MKARPYYSVRIGQHDDAVHFDLEMLRRLLGSLCASLEERGYLQEAFGYECVDESERVPGTLGRDIDAQILLVLRKRDIWPFAKHVAHYSEDDCFDVIELLYDHVSKPKEGGGRYHSFSNCGWHYHEFEEYVGQDEFREQVNSFLKDYGEGWVLSPQGEILRLGAEGMTALLEEPLPHFDPANVEQLVAVAIRKFRVRGSTAEDRKDAIRDLAAVLEYIRDDAEKHLLTKKDDGALFEIANRFAIRHHDGRQKGDYDIDIWYDWMFYFYLATIHAAVQAIKEGKGKERTQ